ncbi:hypothetical protein GCM10009642_09850 [Nocardiopsis metallicus]
MEPRLTFGTDQPIREALGGVSAPGDPADAGLSANAFEPHSLWSFPKRPNITDRYAKNTESGQKGLFATSP